MTPHRLQLGPAEINDIPIVESQWRGIKPNEIALCDFLGDHARQSSFLCKLP
ncbi:MAG: hypothetical protein WC076_06750 [Terrimicrobiaceae bacterium]|nr:hypothetical protein [Terrimicrobiaceae bacterium]